MPKQRLFIYYQQYGQKQSCNRPLCSFVWSCLNCEDNMTSCESGESTTKQHHDKIFATSCVQRTRPNFSLSKNQILACSFILTPHRDILILIVFHPDFQDPAKLWHHVSAVTTARQAKYQDHPRSCRTKNWAPRFSRSVKDRVKLDNLPDLPLCSFHWTKSSACTAVASCHLALFAAQNLVKKRLIGVERTIKTMPKQLQYNSVFLYFGPNEITCFVLCSRCSNNNMLCIWISAGLVATRNKSSTGFNFLPTWRSREHCVSVYCLKNLKSNLSELSKTVQTVHRKLMKVPCDCPFLSVKSPASNLSVSWCQSLYTWQAAVLQKSTT